MSPDELAAYLSGLVYYMVSGLGVGLVVGLLALITRVRG